MGALAQPTLGPLPGTRAAARAKTRVLHAFEAGAATGTCQATPKEPGQTRAATAAARCPKVHSIANVAAIVGAAINSSVGMAIGHCGKQLHETLRHLRHARQRPHCRPLRQPWRRPPCRWRISKAVQQSVGC